MTRKTVIITGVTYPRTKKLVHELRKYCDDNTHIIVSTWEGSEIDVSDVESCSVIFSKDPGPGPKTHKHNGVRHPIQNFNRQLFSVNAGLDFIGESYAPNDRGVVLRLRSDIQCFKNPFDMYFDVPITDKEVSNLSNKLWFDVRHEERNLEYIPSISDWSCLGGYEDVREWYNIEKESRRIAPLVDTCEHIFLVANMIKCDIGKNTPLNRRRRFPRKDRSMFNRRSKLYKRFLDANIVFYSKFVDMGVCNLKYSLRQKPFNSIAPKKP